MLNVQKDFKGLNFNRKQNLLDFINTYYKLLYGSNNTYVSDKLTLIELKEIIISMKEQHEKIKPRKNTIFNKTQKECLTLLNNKEYFSKGNKNFFNIYETLVNGNYNNTFFILLEKSKGFIFNHGNNSLKFICNNNNIVVTDGFEDSINGALLYDSLKDFFNSSLGYYEKDIINNLTYVKKSTDYKNTYLFISGSKGFYLTVNDYNDIKIIQHYEKDMGVLKFEGAGWEKAESNGVGNCRIRTTFYNNEGRLIYLEITGSKVSDNMFHYSSNKHVYHTFIVNHSLYHDVKDPYKEGKLRKYEGNTKLNYTKENILKFVNYSYNCSFTSLDIINDVNIPSVHDTKGAYNVK